MIDYKNKNTLSGGIIMGTRTHASGKLLELDSDTLSCRVNDDQIQV